MPTFWLALVAFYVFFYRLQHRPGLRPARARCARRRRTVTGLYTVDALLAGQMATFFDAAVGHLIAARPGAAAVHGRAADPVHPLGRAGGARPGLRAGRAGQGPARPDGRCSATCCARRSCRSSRSSGLAFGSLLSGTVLVEAIFAWPGIGQYAYQSAHHTSTCPRSWASGWSSASMYLVINLVVDVLYGVIDPRVRCSEPAIRRRPAEGADRAGALDALAATAGLVGWA